MTGQHLHHLDTELSNATRISVRPLRANTAISRAMGKGLLERTHVLGLILLMTLSAPAQVIFNIADGDVVTCGGAMVDSGGEGGPGYGDNESFIATICPDQPGEALSLNTVIFDLSAAGSQPTDVLNIYD